MFWIYKQRIIFKVGKYPYEPIDFPHFSVKINLFFHSKESNYLISPDSGTPPLRPLPFFSSDSTSTTPTTLHIIARESLSYDDIQKAVRKPIRDYIQGDKRSQARYYDNYIQGDDEESVCRPVIELVWKKVSTIITKYVELKVDLNIRMIHSYAYIVGKGRHNAMATSGFKLKEFCGGGAAATDCCTICLAEIGGGAATFRMPCSHLFHSECLVLWLRHGYSCPLCRYEMPTNGSIDRVFDTEVTTHEPTGMNPRPRRARSLIKTVRR